MKKMIKVLLLMASFFMTAYNAKAQTEKTKNQFVKWNIASGRPDDAVIIANFKKALKIEAIPGATYRATADNYRQVYGNQSYELLANAAESDFSIGYSVGNETNWGIDQDTKKSVPVGTMLPNVTVIRYRGVPVAKWGDNGCYNGVTVPVPANDPPDPNSYAGTPPANNRNLGGPNSGSNTNNNTINNVTNAPGNDMLSLYNGMMIRENHMNSDLSVFERLMALKQQNVVTTPVQQVVYGQQPSLVAQTASYNPQQQQQPNYFQNNQVSGRLAVDVTQRARAVDWAAAGGQLMQGVGLLKMAFSPEPLDVKIRGGNNVAYNNGGFVVPTVYGTDFQGSSRVGNNIIGTASNSGTSGYYNNGNWISTAAAIINTNPSASNIIGQR